MLVDLKKYNTLGDRAGVLSFVRTVFGAVCVTELSARALCDLERGSRIFFDAAESFFVWIGWLDVSLGVLSATREYPRERVAADFGGCVCEACFKALLEKDAIILDAVSYDESAGRIVMKRNAFPMDAALFRNVLIQYGGIEETSAGYVLSAVLEKMLEAKVRRYRRMSLESLRKAQEEQAALGERGEAFVEEFERKRLAGCALSDTVRRISEIDVTAGYDIASYATVESKSYDRFVEVKTYSGARRFFWSRNEIEKARLLGKRYLVALVDADRIGDDGYEPEFIEDPCSVFEKTGSWLMVPTAYEVTPIDDVAYDSASENVIGQVKYWQTRGRNDVSWLDAAHTSKEGYKPE